MFTPAHLTFSLPLIIATTTNLSPAKGSTTSPAHVAYATLHIIHENQAESTARSVHIDITTKCHHCTSIEDILF